MQVRSIMSSPRLPTRGIWSQHDLVAALGHDRQLGAGLVVPHAQAQEADPELVADRLDLLKVAPGLGAGLVEVVERRARELELARGLEADRAVGPRERDDVLAFVDRVPSRTW